MDKIYTIFGCIGIILFICVLIYLIASGNIWHYLK